MNYRTLGRTGLSAPEIGLGTMMFGKKTTKGESERIVGKAVARRRNRIILATKVGRKSAVGDG